MMEEVLYVIQFRLRESMRCRRSGYLHSRPRPCGERPRRVDVSQDFIDLEIIPLALIFVEFVDLPQKGKGIYLRLGARSSPPFGLSGDGLSEYDSSKEDLTKEDLTKEDLREGVHRPRVFPPDSASGADITVIQMPQSAAAYATALYDKLHQADQAGVDWIAVDLPPNAPEWEAVNDRLRRAAFNKQKLASRLFDLQPDFGDRQTLHSMLRPFTWRGAQVTPGCEPRTDQRRSSPLGGRRVGRRC